MSSECRKILDQLYPVSNSGSYLDLSPVKVEIDVDYEDLEIKQEALDDLDEEFVSFLNSDAEEEDPLEVEKQDICKEKAISNKNKRYQCQFCDKTFKLKKSLTLHLKSHPDLLRKNNFSRFKCDYCSGNFKFKEDLAEHILSHDVSGKNAETSTKKDKKNSSSSRLKKPLNGPYICFLCSKVFTNKRKYIIHIGSHSKNTMKCGMCSKVFGPEKKLRNHLISHTKEYFKCQICGKLCFSLCYLNRHKKNHDNPTYGYIYHELIPNVSDKIVKIDDEKDELRLNNDKDELKLNDELKLKDNKNELKLKSNSPPQKLNAPYICFLCSVQFTRKKKFVVHIGTHAKNTSKCGMCSMMFEDKKDLRNHLLSHTKLHYKCQICGKLYFSLHDLKLHRKLHYDTMQHGLRGERNSNFFFV